MDFESCLEWIVAGIILIVLLCMLVAVPIISWGNPQTFNGTITSTQIDNGNTYFVIEKSDGALAVYANEDALWYGKFDSSDFLMNLKVGSTYTFMTAGYRIPLLSAYPNIIKYSLKTK